MANRLGRIETFRADIDAVLDTVTAEHAERVIQVSEPLFRGRVSAVRQKAVRLKQPRWTDKLIWVPPKRGAAGRATGAQNALVQAI